LEIDKNILYEFDRTEYSRKKEKLIRFSNIPNHFDSKMGSGLFFSQSNDKKERANRAALVLSLQ